MKIEFGVLALPLDQQIRQQDLEPINRQATTVIESLGEMCSMLARLQIAGLLTERDVDAARKRIMKRLSKIVRRRKEREPAP